MHFKLINFGIANIANYVFEFGNTNYPIACALQKNHSALLNKTDIR